MIRERTPVPKTDKDRLKAAVRARLETVDRKRQAELMDAARWHVVRSPVTVSGEPT